MAYELTVGYGEGVEAFQCPHDGTRLMHTNPHSTQHTAHSQLAMYADSSSSSSKGPGPGGPSLGSGNSSYLRNLGLPTQLCLLVADVAVCINFVVALLVPWVEAKLKVANFWFPVYMPVKIGLLKCFGDVCSMLMGGEDLQHQQHKNNNNIDLQLKADDNSPPPIPSWGPPPASGGGGAGGGAKTLFEVSAVFAVILLSASVLCALGSALLEFARMQGRHDVTGLLPLQSAALASLLCLLAVMQYLFITLAGLHGGHYLVGFWLSLGTAVVTGVLTLGQYLLNRSYYMETDGVGAGAGLFLPFHLKQGGAGYGVDGQGQLLEQQGEQGGGAGGGQRGAYGSLANSR